MSTIVEPMQPTTTTQHIVHDEKLKTAVVDTSKVNGPKDAQTHPLHQFDATQMCKFYEACFSKMQEQHPEWKATKWSEWKPTTEQRHWSEEKTPAMSEPIVFSSQQVLYRAIERLARESGEPMILMPNFNYSDVVNFERFLQALKVDGVNAISKYKQFLNHKDMRSMQLDLVVVHAVYGVLLFEVKDCDLLDTKRRSCARITLNNAANCFKSMGRLIFEAKGWQAGEASVPITEIIALPNQEERPINHKEAAKDAAAKEASDKLNSSLNQSGASSSHSRHQRTLQFVVKSDLQSAADFAKWWKSCIVEPKEARDAELAEQKKVNKFDLSAIQWMTGLITCIHNNSIMPIVCSEAGASSVMLPEQPKKVETVCNEQKTEAELEKEKIEREAERERERQKEEERRRNMPALSINGEFFSREHEAVRSRTKVIVTARNVAAVRATLCKQILWMLLNDHQKKISVVCSEQNKPFYEEFFMRQRKIYNNCTNVRFYTDLESCTVDGQHSTLKKDVETWFFDCCLKKPLENVMERVRELPTFWVFTTEEEKLSAWKSEMEALKVKTINVDYKDHQLAEQSLSLTRSETSFKLPLRMQCDVLVIGDIIGNMHLKTLYRLLTNNMVPNLSSMYTKDGHEAPISNANHSRHQNNQHPMQQLAFNPAKRFKTVKFIRGSSVETIRNSLKMHDSIVAPVVLMHVGDEDLLKSRNSQTTSERIKELAVLVKEYCPKSFVVLSTLMRREHVLSRSENVATSEVNKALKEMCKEMKQSHNFFYMVNTQFDPDFHMTEERTLNNKGLQRYVDNFLWFVDHFYFRNNKQQ